ncbi:chemotaxis protein CheB [Oligoflexus tunisiensis]|uniref:chemotaxis protein CheB n=1 Tax=Oligoflexus tunisiensis TaxID=708132 RepID=UPI000A4BFC91|nr:chemotaxis protein CheB [Oligoflexus tunisiensis]
MTGKSPTRKSRKATGRSHKPDEQPRRQSKPDRAARRSDALPIIVGIGASAGGLEALRALLTHLAGQTGAAIVIVQHMAPQYRSMLAELLSRDAQHKVEQVIDKSRPNADTIYVTPPNHDVIIRDGELCLVDAPDRISPKPSIDRFFSSLAEELGENCGGIILSGTGSDGAQGIKAIKAAGGFAIAQNPESAKYDGMPRAAIHTGVIDLVLTPKEIAEQLPSIITHLPDNDLPDLTVYSEEPFKAILELLKRHTKVDFLQYKPNTLKRRLQRRLKSNRVDLEQYFEMLKKDEAEVKRLFQDVLISVTEFFRDTEQYEALRHCLKRYLQEHRNSSLLRIWSAGCSTGEEPYSIAIIINELLRELKLSSDVQIFATDINDEAMAIARRGLYSSASLAEAPMEIVDRYFERLEGGYQVKKSIRESVVFARHDLTRDPPFLKMDLICCRNVFIYFDQPLQDRIIKIFHYALKPGGILFLGKSESTGSTGSTKSFFTSIDGNFKIFRRNERPSDPSISFSSLQLERGEAKFKSEWPKSKDTIEQLNAMLRAFAPNCIVVDEDLSVREVYGTARRYLELPEGSQTLSIDKLLNPTIRNKTITLLHRAKRNHEMAVGMYFDFHKDGAREVIQPRVFPIKINHEPRLVLSFETVAVPLDEKLESSSHNKSMANEFEQLERELAATREHLQTVIEEQETSNEELQALNEELHSANEELQSTNEELETSNEELQSTNEELTTLNEELNVKSAELIDLNNYLTAVQDAIQYPTIVVDRNLNLVRFNRCAELVFRLHPSQKGKNIRLISTSEPLDLAYLTIEAAFKANEQKKTQIKTKDHDYEVKCDPFYNHKGELDGIVISFVDNTELLRVLRAVEASEKKLNAIFENVPAVITVKNATGHYTYVNRHFCELFELRSEMVIGLNDEQIFSEDVVRAMRERDLQVLGSRISQIREEVIPIKGKQVTFLTSRFPLFGPDGIVESVCAVSFDVTAATEAREKLELFKATISASEQGIFIFERQEDGRYQTTFASQSLATLVGIPASEFMGTTFETVLGKLFDPSPENDGARILRETLASGAALEAKRTTGDMVRYFEARSTAYNPAGSKVATQLSLMIFDVTARKEAEELLRKKHEEVMKAAKLASLGEMAAGIAHELNTPLSTIQSYVDVIRWSPAAENFDEETKSSLDKIESTIIRISEIIVGLKSFAKVDSHQTTTRFDLVELVQEVLRICDFHLRNKGVKVCVDAPGKPLMLHGCRTQICQVLVNLVNNSIDAIRNLQDKWIQIKLMEKETGITIQVIDSGQGIPKKIATMVMTPFFTTKDEGTGLGLSLSRSIVKAHGGDLTINAALPNTCFEVVLPKGGNDGGTITSV